MDHVARSLQLDVEQVKRANLYKQGDTSHTVSLREVAMRFHLLIGCRGNIISNNLVHV